MDDYTCCRSVKPMDNCFKIANGVNKYKNQLGTGLDSRRYIMIHQRPGERSSFTRNTSISVLPFSPFLPVVVRLLGILVVFTTRSY